MNTEKISLGFYVPSLGGDESIGIYDMLNSAAEDRRLHDASLFYNDISFNPVTPKFGIFNATDIWSFTGTLISTSLSNTSFALSIVNNFKLFHLFNTNENNLIHLLDISNRVSVITGNGDDTKEYYRLTGKKSIETNINNIDSLLNLEV